MANENITCCQIPALPALIIERVPKEYTLPGLGLEWVMLVLLHMGIGLAAKDTEVGDGWFSIVECFGWGFAFDSRGGGEVESVEQERASPQKQAGKCESESKEATPSSRIQLVHSAMPFCCGVAQVNKSMDLSEN